MEKESIQGLFKILTDRARLRIIELLNQGELCVCELQERLDMSQPSVSYHLRQMVEAGFLLRRKEGGWTNYRLNPELPGTLKGALDELGLLEDNFDTFPRRERSSTCE